MQRILAVAFIAALLSTSAAAQPVPPPGGGGSGGSTTFANPSATASDTAVNGSATSAMRSDAAPAIQKATSGQFGIVKVDGTTITASGGVISASSGSGTVTSVGTGDGLTGGPITGSGTITGTEALGNSGSAVTGTTYSISLTASTGDLGKELVFTGSSASAWSLGSGSAGQGFDIVNRGTANITITATGNINGASTLVVYPGLAANVFYCGSTWCAWNTPLATSSQFGVMKPDGTTITASGGVMSATGSGGGIPIQYPNTGNGQWLLAQPSSFGASGAGAQNTAYWALYTPTTSYTTDEVGIQITTGSAGGHGDIAIYSDSGGVQNTKLASCATPFGTDSTGNVNCTLSSNVSFIAGTHYWFGLNGDNSTWRYTATGNTDAWQAYSAGADTQAHLESTSANTSVGRYSTLTYGTWSSTPAVAGWINGRTPVIQIHVASVP